ncbi:MarR family winged helix-turn-helix transcriptional regulator [Xanthovirga aplysinae]|uniref:MarR family winged helix-turn-helix transcriptional regulator n=1 Tax=Xanthovirga aplysinae TaxID=2529853 RepID=UPI0012BB6471|nr:MarR family transcriptional regulator [Xanthovirga aplysinae]MTI31239.1 MarR family transcriptional regulator [Xanthovirga aplysinae]
MEIEKEIHQVKFKNEYQKAVINILFTSSWLSSRHNNLLKPFGISTQQFNILRILRGQKKVPVTMKFLSERMIDKMSNASRLVDKLYQKGLVERRECKNDRRQVDIVISDKGELVVNNASEVLESSLNFDQVLPEEHVKMLNQILDKMRTNP